MLDALEYDLPVPRHNAISPPLSPVRPTDHAGDDGDGGGDEKHTFKVVTTKRTLLLCAPSEEEEIKWLSAVRALIARRSGAGVVPGDSAAVATVSHQPASSAAGPGARTPAANEHGHTHGSSALSGTLNPSAPSGGAAITPGGGAGRRRDSIARRLSLGTSGGGVHATSTASASTTAALVTPQEAAI